jgi:hypothetical protein
MNSFTIDFVGVGAAKAGTTWLHSCLSSHPQVCMAEPKELNYFCTRYLWPIPAGSWREGEEWLRAKFPHWCTGQVRGEISPSYLVDPNSARLIHERYPEARVIVCYRNPTDALYSLYHQFARRRPVPRTFEAFIAQCGFALSFGYYYDHTMRYVDCFALEHLHFIVYDDINRQPDVVLSDLYRFLGVATDWRPQHLEERVNVRKGARSVLVRDSLSKLQALLDASPNALRLQALSRSFRLHRLAEWIHQRNLKTVPLEPMRLETRVRLQALYAEQNLLLGELLRRDLSHWNE